LRVEDKTLGTRMYQIPVNVSGQGTADDAPVLVITSPTEGGVISGVVQVTGVATSGEFSAVRTEVGAGLMPSTWFPVDRKTAPVLNSSMASWNTAAVDDGPYTLRVVLEDGAHGQTVTEMMVIVRNEDTGTGTPDPAP